MDVEFIRRCGVALPGTTEHVQWNCLVLKVAGKIYAMAALEPSAICLSLKCTKEEFVELTERPGIIQAPYCAKGQWFALESEEALTSSETKARLRRSYDLVKAKLPKKVQAELEAAPKKRPVRAGAGPAGSGRVRPRP